jgi:hypothetical protein
MSPASMRSSSVANNASIYNTFFLVNSSGRRINHRWLSINSLDQKMYRMFVSASMQQKVHTN